MLALGTVDAAKPKRELDDFEWRGYRFRWAGWRDMPNQYARFGFWTAKDQRDPGLWVSTTLGVCEHYRWEGEVIDTNNRWKVPLMPTKAEEEQLRARALAELRKTIEPLTVTCKNCWS